MLLLFACFNARNPVQKRYSRDSIMLRTRTLSLEKIYLEIETLLQHSDWTKLGESSCNKYVTANRNKFGPRTIQLLGLVHKLHIHDIIRIGTDKSSAARSVTKSNGENPSRSSQHCVARDFPFFLYPDLAKSSGPAVPERSPSLDVLPLDSVPGTCWVLP